MNLLLKSATIVAPKHSLHNATKDILIENGIITQIATTISDKPNVETLTLENLHVSCGWFDTSVSMGEPGYEERETLENGLQVAAKSGFTAVAINPNNAPKTDNKAAVAFLINQSSTAITTAHPIGTLTKNGASTELSELYDMQSSGAIAFGDYKAPIENANLLKIALQYSQNFDGLVLSFPQDKSIAHDGLVNEGANSTLLGLRGIPALAETLRITRDLFLLEYTGGKLHIPTISTAKSVALIREAKKKGLDVTCSVTAHHLTLTDNTLSEFDTNFKVLPPLRTQKDIDSLRAGIEDGTIDIITSDHNPLDIELKQIEFQHASYGTLGMETLYGVLNKVISQDRLITCLTQNPRNRFGVHTASIEEGSCAELTLFTPQGTTTHTIEQIESTSKNTAFLGQTLHGKVYGVIAKNKFLLNK